MGKIKVMAKYRLIGKAPMLLLIFSLAFLSLFALGNFSFIIRRTVLGVADFTSDIALLSVSAAVALIGILLMLLIAAPLRLGCERWFLICAMGEKPQMKDIFYYFNAAGISRSISGVMFCLSRKLLAFSLFALPSVCLFAVLYFSFGEGEISLYITYALSGFAVLLFALGLVFYFVYTARYAAYYSVIVANKKTSPHRALEKSIAITEGAYAKICFFRLSFLPWFLLCGLVFPTFYVWGYYKEAKTMLSLNNEILH